MKKHKILWITEAKYLLFMVDPQYDAEVTIPTDSYCDLHLTSIYEHSALFSAHGAIYGLKGEGPEKFLTNMLPNINKTCRFCRNNEFNLEFINKEEILSYFDIEEIEDVSNI